MTDTTIRPPQEQDIFPPKDEKPASNCLYITRMKSIRDWVFETCCKGRRMKTGVVKEVDAVKDGRKYRGKDTEIKWTEPRCFGGNFWPLSASEAKQPYTIAPSILVSIIGNDHAAESAEYLDSRQGIHRPEDFASTMTVSLVHTVYEPGERTGEKTADGGERFREAFEHDDEMDVGSLVLGGWMDDTMTELASCGSIPGTDLMVKKETIHFEPLIENGAISDRRPLYMGVVSFVLVGLTRKKVNRAVEALL